MTAALALLGAVIAGVVACGQATGNIDGALHAGGPDLNGTTYVVTGVTEDGQRRTLVRGTEVRIAFADGRMTLTAGCNTMSGGYSFDHTRMTVAPLAMTDMGCDTPRAQQDAWLAGLFEAPVQYSAGASPAIISGRTVLSLTDRRVASPDRPLAATKWVLDSIVDAGTASSVPAGTVAYLAFVGSQVQVYDGCNSGAGPATVRGDRITFGGRSQTLRGCLGAGAGVTQTGFQKVLDGEATWSIKEGSLTITKGTRALGFRAVQEFPQPQ